MFISRRNCCRQQAGKPSEMKKKRNLMQIESHNIVSEKNKVDQ